MWWTWLFDTRGFLPRPTSYLPDAPGVSRRLETFRRRAAEPGRESHSRTPSSSPRASAGLASRHSLPESSGQLQAAWYLNSRNLGVGQRLAMSHYLCEHTDAFGDVMVFVPQETALHYPAQSVATSPYRGQPVETCARTRGVARSPHSRSGQGQMWLHCFLAFGTQWKCGLASNAD